MSWPNYWSAEDWLYPGIGLFVAALLAVGWSYLRARASGWIKVVSPLLKLIGVGLLVLCLLEPMRREFVPRKDANIFVVLADQSQSLQIKDASSGSQTRQQRLQTLLDPKSDWQASLEEDFDLRRYSFDSRLHPVDEYVVFAASGEQTQLFQSLKMLAERYAGKPNAGILLFSDGNATDSDAGIDWSTMPPVYPVVVGGDAEKDIAISQVSISQTNFESAPVTITAELTTRGHQGKSVAVQLLDDQQHEVKREIVADVADDKRFAVRFEVKPETPGVTFYAVRAFERSAEAEFDKPQQTAEATLANNQRLLAIDRGQGPYRILYVSGRPNWELKFLRRALSEDDELEFYSLVRVAKREPKFSFRSHAGESTNPLFRGFGNEEDEEAEQYDQPVLLALPVDSPQAKELRRGFPRKSEDLFQYDALILDDVEAAFFTQDTQSLIEQFVSGRGGSLLMLGGQETFAKGAYDRTPIGSMLPIYLDRPAADVSNTENAAYRLVLTREGWLQPWVRVRATEEQEQLRLKQMPSFQTLNRASSIKPGASVLAQVRTGDGDVLPALVVQRYGKGRTAALLIGDLWRWQLRDADDNDLMKSWRQTVRWLVSDVPHRMEVSVDQENSTEMNVRIRLRDADFKPLDNCKVNVVVTPHHPKTAAPSITSDAAKTGAADQKPPLELIAQSVDDEAGAYQATFVPREPGAYRVDVVATDSDGNEVGSRQTGWVHQGAADEFRQMNANRDALERIAKESGGRVVAVSELDRFVKLIPNNRSMITETKVYPWWHHWTVFAAAVTCLVAEWGLRRWKGLA